MKLFLFAFIAAVAVLSTEATLQDDFDDIGKLIPVDKVKAIAAKHMLLDKQFQDFVKFIKTDEFKTLWDKLMTSNEFRQIVVFVHDGSGYDMVASLNKLAALLKVNPYPQLARAEIIRTPRTVNSFLTEVLRAMPKNEMSLLMKEKMLTSPDWNKFISHLSQQKFTELIDTAMKASSTAEIRQALEKRGVNLKKIVEGGLEILKWSHFK